MAALSLIATADGEAIFCVDDIVLEASEDIENLSTEGARTGRLTSIREAPPAPRPTPSKTIFLRSDVCVVGGGSGGIGAAAAAARGGASVLLIEREAMLGGTSTSGGVA
ncbi:MAG: FAD-dependent oxidoreductase, partial [Lentisphaeria bacterium]|nr:FAD-dependent oxidoreductase [Lentisphaeria bacterium]